MIAMTLSGIYGLDTIHNMAVTGDNSFSLDEQDQSDYIKHTQMSLFDKWADQESNKVYYTQANHVSESLLNKIKKESFVKVTMKVKPYDKKMVTTTSTYGTENANYTGGRIEHFYIERDKTEKLNKDGSFKGWDPYDDYDEYSEYIVPQTEYYEFSGDNYTLRDIFPEQLLINDEKNQRLENADIEISLTKKALTEIENFRKGSTKQITTGIKTIIVVSIIEVIGTKMDDARWENIKKEVNILAIESSCDETAVAVVEDGRKILSDAIASQADLHALYGGVVPEIASRKHIEAIAALTDQALKEAGVEKKDIDAVAATYAPGLIGAVLVGLNFAKSAAYALNVPLIPVHHIRGHIAANYLAFPELEPPFLALCMSGGNTLIVDVRDYTDFALLGATRDDAAGECFDKAARVLGLPYPGGAAMDKLAHESEGGVYELPRAKIDGCPLDMSFSGLKTAVVNLAHNAEQTGKQLDRAALARDFTQAVVDELVPRAMLAMQQSGRKVLVAAGGVAANSFIRAELEKECRKHGYRLYMPPLKLCGDNGAMIGAQGYYEYLAGARADWALNAYATRDIDDPIV